MSKKHSKKASAPSAEVVQHVLTADDLMRMFRPDPINVAIERVTQWPAVCPGPCFPIVHRGWMTWPPFANL